MQGCAPELEARLAAEAGREEDVFDSHPTLAARIEAIPQALPPAGGDVAMNRLREELSPLLDRLSSRANELLASSPGRRAEAHSSPPAGAQNGEA